MSPNSRHIIAVFLKFPEPGKVKTRLAAEFGAVEAAAIYRRLAKETLRHLPWSMVEVWLCFDPAGREDDVREWLTPLIPPNAVTRLVPQISGDLGDRLRAVMESAFLDAPAPASLTLIGTDCPDLRWPVFVITRCLPRDGIDVVFGATLDGGYYLLTMSRPCPELFENIPWSSPETLAVSIAAAAGAGRRVHLLERRLRDIDTPEDFRAIRGSLPL